VATADDLDHGLPGAIRLDNEPQFRQSFTALCTSIGIVHEMSSPYHPASNGLAEAAVKSMKRFLGKVGGVDNVVFRSVLLMWQTHPGRTASPRSSASLGAGLEPSSRLLFHSSLTL
jgi:transposase InsO family protein